MAILTGAEPFFFPGGDHGVLLSHGFTGSPAEMRLLGEYLSQQGYTVYGPRLPGHGTQHQDLEKTDWHQWYGALEDGFHILQGICREVSVVGLSMGGILALLLAGEYPVRRVASLSAPIYIADRRIKWLNWYRLFYRYAPKGKQKAPVSPEHYVGYSRTPLRSLFSLLELIQQVKVRLPMLRTPLFIAQSKADQTVRPESADYIFQHVGSSDKELFWLEHSGHIVTLDTEKEQVFKKVAEFLEKPFDGARQEREN